MTKLEDLTDEELDQYVASVDDINSRLCNGERKFDIALCYINVTPLIIKKFRDSGWNVIRLVDTCILEFTSALETWNHRAPRDNHGTHSARYSSQTRVPESPPVS